jgi:hypothetical protein
MIIQTWAEATTIALQNLWQGFLTFIPKLIGAIIVFTLGWIIAVAAGKLVVEVLNRLKFNKIFEKSGWTKALERAELKVNASEFIGGVVKWIFIIVFLLAAVDILGLEQFAVLLTKVLNYLPNVVVAALIFVVAVIIADIVEKIVRAALEGAQFAYANIGGLIIKWAIWIFAILAILRQLLVVPELVEIFFGALVYGVVALLVISLGISFGLGGKDVAAEILRDLRNKLRR